MRVEVGLLTDGRYGKKREKSVMPVDPPTPTCSADVEPPLPQAMESVLFSTEASRDSWADGESPVPTRRRIN